MSDALSILEFLAVDIMFIGVLTLGFFRFVLLVCTTPNLRLLKTFNNFRVLPEGLKGTELLFASAVAIVVSAAMLGMIINLIADEILDGHAVAPYIPYFPELNEPLGADNAPRIFGRWDKETGRFTTCEGDGVEGWKPEDDIKEDEFYDLMGLEHDGSPHKKKTPRFTPDQQRYLHRYLENCEECLGSPCSDGPEVQTGLIQAHLNDQTRCEYSYKSLYQDAYAVVLASESDNLKTMIANELLTIKVIRVIFLDIGVLLLIYAHTMIRPAAWKNAFASLRQPDKALGRLERGVICCRFLGTYLLTLVVLILCLSLSLRLWSDQSERYNKKILFAYMQVTGTTLAEPAAEGDPDTDE